MVKFENCFRLSGFVSPATIRTNDLSDRSIISFGIRIPSVQNVKNGTESLKRTVYATQFVKGFFPLENKDGILDLLRKEKSVVTVEGRFRAENFDNKEGVRCERLTLMVNVLEEAKERQEYQAGSDAYAA